MGFIAHDMCIACSAVGKKEHFGMKPMLNSEEIKPVALSIVELRYIYLGGGIS